MLVAEAEEGRVEDAEAEVLEAGAVEVGAAVDEAGAVDFEELVAEVGTVDEGAAADVVVLAVVEGVTEDETFVLEDTAVEDFAAEELELIGIAPVPGAWYIFSLFEPPQNSDELPAHCILQFAKPSGAGPPPPVKVLAQSTWDVSMMVE